MDVRDPEFYGIQDLRKLKKIRTQCLCHNCIISYVVSFLMLAAGVLTCAFGGKIKDIMPFQSLFIIVSFLIFYFGCLSESVSFLKLKLNGNIVSASVKEIYDDTPGNAGIIMFLPSGEQIIYKFGRKNPSRELKVGDEIKVRVNKKRFEPVNRLYQ